MKDFILYLKFKSEKQILNVIKIIIIVITNLSSLYFFINKIIKMYIENCTLCQVNTSVV